MFSSLPPLYVKLTLPERRLRRASNRGKIIRGIVACVTFLALSACGGGGGGSSATAPVQQANQPPTATFSVTPSRGNAPLVVTVDASASSDTDGEIQYFGWDFAGTSGIGPVAQHTFTDPGSQLITLTVRDDDGASSTQTFNVTVDASTSQARLSGIVRILSSTAIDSDVNDRLSTPVPNNTFGEAQPLNAPATVGGFANTQLRP